MASSIVEKVNEELKKTMAPCEHCGEDVSEYDATYMQKVTLNGVADFGEIRMCPDCANDVRI